MRGVDGVVAEEVAARGAEDEGRVGSPRGAGVGGGASAMPLRKTVFMAFEVRSGLRKSGRVT